VLLLDDVMPAKAQNDIYAFLSQSGWNFGWKSKDQSDTYAFFHRHFGGSRLPDHCTTGREDAQYDCAEELSRTAPALYDMWLHLQNTALKQHTLRRCYANGHPYGSEGTTHTDSMKPTVFTGVYFPHLEWHPNWGGETILFNQEQTDIISAVYPRPNRLLIFPGTIPHVARGVSRTCPKLRITLMFKFELQEEGGDPSLLVA
jgi:SM-20-related protein